MTRFAMRLCAAAVLVAAATSLPAQPTAAEQAFIYELNRARNNPQAFAAAHGLGSLLDGITPAQPLAVNNELTASARFHSQEMATHGYFAHTSPITGDQPNKMARDAGYPLHSGLSNTANNIESLAVRFTAASGGISYAAAQALADLIEDDGVVPPGHRYHLLSTGPGKSFYDQFREVGTGYVQGFRPEFPFSAGTPPDGSGAYWTIHTGYRNADSVWLTGVVYNDANSNGRYDQGEGIGGVTVTATGSSTPMATTNAHGGWSIAVSAGNWTVSCSGASFTGTSAADATVGTNNVQVDFISGQADGSVDFQPPVPSGPTITLSATSRSFNTSAAGTPSSPQNYTVAGVNLTDAISISAPANFEISLSSGTGFTGNLSLPHTGGVVATTTIWVRYAPLAGSSHNGNVFHSSAGATSKNVTVNGTVGSVSSGKSGGGGGRCQASGTGAFWPAAVCVLAVMTLRRRRMTAR